jgi:hypothetical protein
MVLGHLYGLCRKIRISAEAVTGLRTRLRDGNPPSRAAATSRAESNMERRSRGATRPSLALALPSIMGGRGECRALAAPMVRQLKKCWRQEPQVQPRHPGIPRAMVYGLYVLSPGTGLVAPVTGGSSPPAWPQRREARTTRFRRPRRAVRPQAKACCSIARPSHSAATIVTIAIRPHPSNETGGPYA